MAIETPEMTLAQLGITVNGPYASHLVPRFIAMDNGQDCPGGVWHLFEKEPEYAFMRGRWVSDGRSYEIGGDDTDDLSMTPVPCRWLRPGWSLIRIVDEVTSTYQHGDYAFLRPRAERNVDAVSNA